MPFEFFRIEVIGKCVCVFSPNSILERTDFVCY